jgi:hypothetical protein
MRDNLDVSKQSGRQKKEDERNDKYTRRRQVNPESSFHLASIWIVSLGSHTISRSKGFKIRRSEQEAPTLKSTPHARARFAQISASASGRANATKMAGHGLLRFDPPAFLNTQ